MCPAHVKNCLKYGSLNHFEKCVVNLKLKTLTQITDQINELTRSKQKKTSPPNEPHENYNPDFDSNRSPSDDNCVATISSESKKNEPMNKKLRTGTMETMICTIINKSIAQRVVATAEFFFWNQGTNAREFRTNSNSPMPIVNKIQSSIAITGCAAKPVVKTC